MVEKLLIYLVSEKTVLVPNKNSQLIKIQILYITTKIRATETILIDCYNFRIIHKN